MLNSTNAQITAAYNDAAATLGRKLVNRFSSKTVALKRTNALMAELRSSESINMPFRGLLHAIRKNTLNDRIRTALRSGATMVELAEVTAKFDTEKGNVIVDSFERARATVRMMNTYTGLGISQVGDTLYVVEAA